MLETEQLLPPISESEKMAQGLEELFGKENVVKLLVEPDNPEERTLRISLAKSRFVKSFHLPFDVFAQDIQEEDHLKKLPPGKIRTIKEFMAGLVPFISAVPIKKQEEIAKAAGKYL